MLKAGFVGDVEMVEWKQERPSWCCHADCQFSRRVQDSICGGILPVPVEHNGDVNRFRVCLRSDEQIEDYMCNETDLDWCRWIFDALDGKKTSWLSKRQEMPK